MKEDRAGEPLREQSESGASSGREQAARKINAPAVDAVGERGPVRNRRYVTGKERAGDETRFRVRQAPQVAQFRKQRGERGEAQHRKDMGRKKKNRRSPRAHCLLC